MSCFYGLRDWKDTIGQSFLVFLLLTPVFKLMDFKLLNPINISYLCLQQMVARLTQWQKENWEELLWWEGMNRHKGKCRRNGAREETDVDSKRWHSIVTDSARRPCSRTLGFFYSILGVKNVCYSFSLRNNYVRTRRPHIWLLLCPSIQHCLTFVSWGESGAEGQPLSFANTNNNSAYK